ncbi:MAG TPA: hypothetical protein VJH75_01525 [Patescibacteria group bacterium]|nr:hypothetical protein [Patescibacteria group bacterium]
MVSENEVFPPDYGSPEKFNISRRKYHSADELPALEEELARVGVEVELQRGLVWESDKAGSEPADEAYEAWGARQDELCDMRKEILKNKKD